MDHFDRAQEADARFREQALSVHRTRAQSRAESLHYCEDCGEEIPEGRRKARPGCSRCLKCQQAMEEKLTK